MSPRSYIGSIFACFSTTIALLSQGRSPPTKPETTIAPSLHKRDRPCMIDSVRSR
ncbi:MAG: hypothetical protein RBJ76_21945 [Stenomitos frigidus ULC029]